MKTFTDHLNELRVKYTDDDIILLINVAEEVENLRKTGYLNKFGFENLKYRNGLLMNESQTLYCPKCNESIKIRPPDVCPFDPFEMRDERKNLKSDELSDDPALD